ncbi:MAG: HAD family hydrolase [Candidatus Odinarchaeota archaeon]
MPNIAIFFDDGGVMSNNTVKGEQWKELVPKYFVPRYGGNPATWSLGNYECVQLVIEKVDELIKSRQDISYEEFQALEDRIMIEHLFTRVGITPPPEKRYETIRRSLEKWVAPQINSEVPGIVQAIEILYERGFTLHTASGETSWLLEGYLTGMGVLQYFRNLYGPDLVGIMKGGVKFYEAVFKHAGIDPSCAIVIDDKSELLESARQAGARTIHSCVLNEQVSDGFYRYKDPADLPELVDTILKEY